MKSGRGERGRKEGLVASEAVVGKVPLGLFVPKAWVLLWEKLVRRGLDRAIFTHIPEVR